MDHGILQLTGHSKFVEDCRFSADGSKIVSCGGDGKVFLWETERGQILNRIGRHDAETWSCDFSACGTYICSASSDKTVRIWDERTHGHIAAFQGHTKTVWSCAFHPDATSFSVASASSDMSVKIWNWKTLSVEQNIENHKNIVENVAFTRNGETLVTCGRDRTVQIFENYANALNRKVKLLITHEMRVNHCCFSGQYDELVLSCSDDKTVKVWDRNKLINTHTLVGHQNIVWGCDGFMLNDAMIVISCSSDKTLRFWDITSEKELKTMRKMTEDVESEAQLHSCHISPNLTQIAVCSNNGNLYLIETRLIFQELHNALESQQDENPN